MLFPGNIVTVCHGHVRTLCIGIDHYQNITEDDMELVIMASCVTEDFFIVVHLET